MIVSTQSAGGFPNVASTTAAFQPDPYVAVYYATNAYALSFTEALNQELKRGYPLLQRRAPTLSGRVFRTEHANKKLTEHAIKRLEGLMVSRTLENAIHDVFIISGLMLRVTEFCVRGSPQRLSR